MRSNLTHNAQELRRNMTLEERILWYRVLKPLPFPVRRQKVLSPFIVDFYIPSKKIVIEVDGSQHYEGAGIEKDSARDLELRKMGFTVLRYPNNEIRNNLQGVYEDIARHCGMDV